MEFKRLPFIKGFFLWLYDLKLRTAKEQFEIRAVKAEALLDEIQALNDAVTVSSETLDRAIPGNELKLLEALTALRQAEKYNVELIQELNFYGDIIAENTGLISKLSN